MSDDEIRIAAIAFARQNKNRIARAITDVSKYIPDATPISAFMAGSPGAGKTEFSKSLIGILEKNENIKHSVLRIDGDEIRSLIPGYTGKNSELFQGAISIIIDKIHDCVLKQKQTFVLDGMFAHYGKAIQNIKRSLEKKRTILIFYVYQEPQVAWKFTQAREVTEGRNIPKAGFIEGFFGAKETVDRIRKEFGDEVVVFLVKKDFEKNTVEDVVNIASTGKQIDDYLHRRYTVDDLEKLL